MFQINSRFYTLCVKIYRLMGLSLLFVLFSLPFVTLPGALSALIYTAKQGEIYVFRTFVKAFKRSVFRSLVVGIFSLCSIFFIMELYHLVGFIPYISGIVFYFVASFVIMYNLSCYLLVGYPLPIRLDLFRRSFVFTLATFRKTFFFPLIGLLCLAFLPEIIGVLTFTLIFGILVSIYVRMIRKEIAYLEVDEAEESKEIQEAKEESI